MARPTQERVQKAPGFAPQVQASPSLGVFASTNVRAAPANGAAALANILGIGSQIASPILEDRIEKKSYDSATQGKLDAALGKVDERRAKEDRHYDLGQKRGIVEKKALDALSEWQAQYEKMDKNLDEDEVVAQFNSFMQQQLGGLAVDADARKWLLDRLQPAEAQLRNEHRTAQAAEFKLEMRATAGDMVRQALATKQPVDMEGVKQVLMGAGLSRGEATAEYVDVVGSIAQETHNPKLLDALIPDKWTDGTPGPRSLAALNNKINQYRYYAEQGEEADKAAARRLAKEQSEGALLSITQMAARGDVAGALRSLDQAIANGAQIDRSDYSAVVSFARGSRDDRRDQVYSPTRVAEFRLRMITEPDSVTPKDAAMFVANNFPNDEKGFRSAQTFLDDFQSAYKAARDAETNPKAKAYRQSFVTRFKPDAGSTRARIERYAASMQAFDLEFAESRDPEKAREASEKVFEATKEIGSAPSGSVREDVTAFFKGEMDEATFRRTYDKEGSIYMIKQALRKGEITSEQALKAARALQ